MNKKEKQLNIAKSLKLDIEKIFSIDSIKGGKGYQDRESTYLRFIYYKIGYSEFELSISCLAETINQWHATGLNALKKHDILMESKSIYSHLYNYALEKLISKPLIIKPDYSELLLQICDELKYLNNSELKELKNYRIDPFLKMRNTGKVKTTDKIKNINVEFKNVC